MDWPTIAVIVPTYQREEVLCNALRSALAQDYPAYSVMVVDQTQAHQPTTQRQLETWAKAGEITWYPVPWASLPAARNFGIERSRSDVVLFIDDDVVLPPGYLCAHARTFVERPDVGAVAGRVFDRMKLAEQDFEIDYLPAEAMNPGIAWYYLDLVHTTQPQRVLTARGCNMSFRRELFDKHGLRFDERFYGSAVREESDFCLHVRQTGYIIWYNPAAHLVHLGEETGGCHGVETRSLSYQMNFDQNHFLLALKNLTLRQNLRLYGRLFDCHVLGHPPCNKSGHPLKVVSRGLFFAAGWFYAVYTLATTLGKRGRLYADVE
ncbi:MAG: hormogonium polysaccharide biosynthesis glycosyltransferase HpsN [Nodosilinea sp.]